MFQRPSQHEVIQRAVRPGPSRVRPRAHQRTVRVQPRQPLSSDPEHLPARDAGREPAVRGLKVQGRRDTVTPGHGEGRAVPQGLRQGRGQGNRQTLLPRRNPLPRE